MDFKHVIWDFDGTLFDTYPHTARAFQVVLKREYGVMENTEEIEAQMHINMQHAYDYYVEKYEIDDEFWQKFREYCTLYENQNALPFNNAYMICKFVFDQGSFNYLLTHRDRGVNSMLQKHGFNELFKDFVTQEDGFPRKPDPAGLNHLIGKYNMNKNETLYIGDREVDMQCAKAAGVKSCFFSENINLSFKADFRMQNFSDFYYMLNSTLSTAEKGNRTDE